MARKGRIFVPGGVYHIYCRVARGEPVFDNQIEVENWLQAVSYAAWIHGLKIFAWCLMSNHYHLVIRASNMPLWRAMAVVQGRVAKDFNRRHGFMGRLWQSRYKARVVQVQEYLDHLFAYVHLNPVAAGIVEDPLDFAASGHAELLGAAKPRLCDVREALLTFGEDLTAARSIYAERVRAVAESRWLSTGVRDLPWWQTVDDDDETLPRDEAPDEAVDFLGESLPPEVDRRPNLSAVLRLFEETVGLANGEIAGHSRTRLLSWYRSLFGTFAVSRLGYQINDTANIMGKAPGSVSRWVSDGLYAQQTDAEFRKALDMLAFRFSVEWPEADFLPNQPGKNRTL